MQGQDTLRKLGYNKDRWMPQTSIITSFTWTWRLSVYSNQGLLMLVLSASDPLVLLHFCNSSLTWLLLGSHINLATRTRKEHHINIFKERKQF